jgi:hypothetical protein
MSTTAPSVPQPLPLWPAVRASYGIVIQNFGQLIRMSWLWLLILLPVTAALRWLSLEIEPWEAEPAGSLLDALANLIQLPALASIAVAWHRLVLRHERVQDGLYLRLDRTVLRYTVYLFILFVLTDGPITIVTSLLAGDSADPITIGIAFGIILLALAIAIFVLPRLSLVLPAIALGENLALAAAWQLTRGNTWRLAMATLLCSLPLALAFAVLFWFLTDETNISSVLQAAPNALVYVLIVTVGVTLLSLAYRHFVWRQDIAVQPSA